jgi:hypothetical protein
MVKKVTSFQDDGLFRLGDKTQRLRSFGRTTRAQDDIVWQAGKIPALRGEARFIPEQTQNLETRIPRD